jgi:hypothetical protein
MTIGWGGGGVALYIGRIVARMTFQQKIVFWKFDIGESERTRADEKNDEFKKRAIT